MSTSFRVRLTPWLAFVTWTLLAGLLPAPTQAQSRKEPPAQYASLPDDPLTTGSLPDSSRLSTRTLSGFYAYVAKGTITLRDSTPTKCLPGDLRQVVADVAARFGPVSIQSTHRTRVRNRRAGGAKYSLHLSCRAIDFRVRAKARGVMAYLRSREEVGGLKIYRNGIIHIDNGSRRTW
ncbi:YcbK family protein [Microvirga roseola]|uniref:YcbK family protein n=1 Tax=Microvirga roseola TaxID=2883126 RepID=UPI001E285D7E|nr:D-Ala-D-Ala carboxypeptidase family metallohydrolase [Microvirga roseola]